MPRGRRDVGNGLDRPAIVAARRTDHCLCAFNRPTPLLTSSASRDPSQAIPPAFDVARDTANGAHHVLGDVVQASDERSSFGNFNRTTVRISSRPARMLTATPSHADRLDARHCGSILQPFRRHRAPRLAQHPTGGRMMLFRQAFHDVCAPCRSGSAGSWRPNRRCGRSPSTTLNSLGTAGSRPRETRSSSRA
ncbi:hypothetical protein ACVWZL_000689 [Bradyrhizobium sp. GM2.4]